MSETNKSDFFNKEDFKEIFGTGILILLYLLTLIIDDTIGKIMETNVPFLATYSFQILCLTGIVYFSYSLGNKKQKREIEQLKLIHEEELNKLKISHGEIISNLQENIRNLKNPPILERCLKLNDPATKKDRYFAWNGRLNLHLIREVQDDRQMRNFEQILHTALIKENLNPIQALANSPSGDFVYEISNDGKAKWRLLFTNTANLSGYRVLAVEPLVIRH